MQVAVVAAARELAVLCWHLINRGADYAFAQPSLIAKKQRALELRAGQPPRRGQKGRAGPVFAQQSDTKNVSSPNVPSTRIAAWSPTGRPNHPRRAEEPLDAFIRVDNITFETDYPHTDSTWPDTKKVAEELMSGLPADAVYKIMRGNAIRMLKLEGD
jgi:Amidohydrolase